MTRVGLGFTAAKKSARCKRNGWIKRPPESHGLVTLQLNEELQLLKFVSIFTSQSTRAVCSRLRRVVDDLDVHQLTYDGGLVIRQELVGGGVVNHETPALDGVENIAAGDRRQAGYISVECCNRHFGCGWIEKRQATAGFRGGADFSAIVGAYRDLAVGRNFKFVVIAVRNLEGLRRFCASEINYG